MRTRRSYFPITTNVTIPRRRQRKQNSNIVELEIRTIIEMADNRTMDQMLQAPIEGYEDAIIVPPINANNFELKQTLINLVQSNQFTGEARIWLDKEPPRSILTWEDLVSKFINQFFPPSKTTYLRNEIINFLQKPNETFNEAWERFKDLLRQCPHHSFSELHQLDTFYNALNPNDQDALDLAARGNFLDKIPRESKLDIRMSRFEKSLNDMKASFVTPTAPIKEVEEVCVTCGANHSYNRCSLTRGNEFPIFQDNIQQFQTATVGNFVQGNRNSNLSSQIRPPGFNQPNHQNNQNRYQGNNFNHNQNRQNNQGVVYQNPPQQASTYQAPVSQNLNNKFEAYTNANDANMTNFQMNTAHAIINVHKREIILRQGKQSLTLQCGDTPSIRKYKFESLNKIDFIDVGESDLYSEEIENHVNDDSIPIGVENFVFNMKEDILFLERLLSEDPSPLNTNQTNSFIKEPEHSFIMGYEHFNTTLVTKFDEVAESCIKNLVPILRECEVNSTESESNEPIKDDYSVFTLVYVKLVS
nr:hypothetical protein [Tanacetum cinerariifolium]